MKSSAFSSSRSQFLGSSVYDVRGNHWRLGRIGVSVIRVPAVYPNGANSPFSRSIGPVTYEFSVSLLVRPPPRALFTLQLICFCITCSRSVVLIAPLALIANQFAPCDLIAPTDRYAGERKKNHHLR